MKILKLNETIVSHHYLINGDTERADKVETFIHLYNLDTNIILIWEYIKDELKLYPNKITDEEILYITPDGHKLSIQLNNGEMTKIIDSKIVVKNNQFKSEKEKYDFSLDKLEELLRLHNKQLE